MVRVYRSAKISPLWLLVALVALIFVGLPLVIAAVAVFVVLNTIFAVLRGPNRSTGSRPIDPDLSAVIDNPEIGPYRVKQNPNDPSVIEVVDEK